MAKSRGSSSESVPLKSNMRARAATATASLGSRDATGAKLPSASGPAASSCSSRSPAGSPTRTSRSRWTARSASSGSAARTRSCSPSTAPSSTAPRSSPAELGIGPEVVGFVEPEGYLVTRFIEGRPIPPEEMRRPETIARAAAVLRRLHDGPPIPGSFDSFRVVEAYAETAAAHGVTVPEVFEWAHGVALRIEAARGGPVPVACHNDYQNLNFLDDDGDIRIVDWEYAGMGDRFFDLANFSINHEFDDEANAVAPRGLLRRATGRGRAGAPAHALHVRLPRGHVGRRPAGRLRPRRRLRRLGLPAFRPDAANGGRGRVSGGAGPPRRS